MLKSIQNHRRLRLTFAAVALGAWTGASARANQVSAPPAGPPAASNSPAGQPASAGKPAEQPAPAASGTAAEGPATPAGPAVPSSSPAAEAPPAAGQPAAAVEQRETFIAFPPALEGAAGRERRSKPLRTTVGIPPTASDLGNELDLAGAAYDAGGINLAELQNWTLNLRGYIRAPMRVGIGPNDASPNLKPFGQQLHAPPRMVGFSSSNWAYIALAPNTSASLRATVSNSRVSGTLILTTSAFPDVGYDNLDSTGGFAQGFITLKFPETFGSRGGVAVTLGSFSHSYGTAGTRQTNTGFYGTYLFGRTHLTGGNVTANIDLTDHVLLMVEDGFGAKLDLLPVLGASLPKQMFIPGDPHASLGSNFVHHAHVGLWVDDWLKIGAHYLTSWTPNDRVANPSGGTPRLSVAGADVHVDHPRWGSFYLGYSHAWAHNLYPLDEGLQVIHGGRGYDFKLQYFGNKLRQDGGTLFTPNDGGRVETVLFQYTARSHELFQHRPAGPAVNVALFAMFSHAYSPPTGAGVTLVLPAATLVGPFTVDDNKLKYGTLAELAAFRHVSFNARFDRVQPTSFDKLQSYTALSGQVMIRSDWRSSRVVIIDYTRFLLGAHCYPDSPYSTSQLNKQADPHLLFITAIMSL